MHPRPMDAKSRYAELPPIASMSMLSARASDLESADSLNGNALPNRDQMLIEHLPRVRYLARRIHERLPQHVELDDLISAGVVGLIDAFSKFDHTKQVQVQQLRAVPHPRGHPGFAAHAGLEPGASCAARDAPSKRLSAPRPTRSDAFPSENEIAREMELPRPSTSNCWATEGIGDRESAWERSEDSGDEEIAYIPGSPDEDSALPLPAGGDEGRG